MERNLQDEEQGPGHYQLKRLLGEGGFGQVYEAWDSKLQRIIAIKRLKPQLLSARPENLLDEARLAASLRHPGFVRIFSIEGDAAQQSIIMEFVDGCTLREAGKRGPMPEAQVLDIVDQVADAMCEAHAAKLIHGDLKPANLMLEPGGRVRIMDFGLARKIDPQATESVVFDQTEGTIAYLAPELMMGSTLSPQSDVYALGVVMYELLTGTRPFSHLSGLALAAAHIQSSSGVWPFPPDASPDVIALVRAMAARQPEDRLASMQAVRAALAALGGGPGAPLAAAAPARSLRSRAAALLNTRARRYGLLAVVVVVSIGAGQALIPPAWFGPHTPFFSESAAMRGGLTALTTFDRDESLDLAIRNFTSILDRQPDHAAAAAGLSLAYALRHTGDTRDDVWLRRADASAQLALKLNDQLALAYAAQGVVRMGQQRDAEALDFADKALRLDPMDRFGLLLKGDALTRMRRYAEAERTLLDAVRMHERDHVFLDLLGTLYHHQGKYLAAEQSFRRSIVLEPDAVIAYANLSSALLRQNRTDEALQVLQQGLQVRPSGRLYNNLGNVLFNRGDYVGAAQAFEESVSGAKGNPNDYLRWANLGDTLRWIPGRTAASNNAYRQAVGLLKPLLERSGSKPVLISRMGLYSARVGDRDAAMVYTRQALKADPSSADVHFRAAMSHEILGDRDTALAELMIAQERGYPANLIRSEPDLTALRRDPRYLHSTTKGEK
ncbi:protein kinase domain-containing protein [Massilia rubra]|uniref:non-specific serine/threonine protein kinase n=1 Tax=Massilia rubra TaxID=2607910 RepID=A0ABX0LE53_9BURK|nr:protein kinase [Massilia rubra]